MSYVLHKPNMYCICIRGRLNVCFELFSHGHSHLATLLLGEQWIGLSAGGCLPPPLTLFHVGCLKSFPYHINCLCPSHVSLPPLLPLSPTNESWLFLFWLIGSATCLVLRSHCRWHFLLLMEFVSWGVVCVWSRPTAKSNAIETNLTL